MGDITQWFNAVDKDRSGRIDARELQNALAMGHLNFSLQTIAQMIRLYDTDRTGTITLQEFQGLHTFLLSMQSSFQYFDRDRSGALTRDEVYQALSHAQFNLDQHAFEALFRAFDPDRSQSLAMPEFMAMTVFLRLTSSMFGAFDTQRSGKIALDYNQFIFAAANCR